MHKSLDTIVTVTLVVSAVLVSGGFAYRTFTGSDRIRADSELRAVEMKTWSSALAKGHQVAGDSTSPATLLVLTDLECPACRGFHTQTLRPLIAKYPRDLRVIYAHYPLAYHKHALPAARATECVAQSGEVARWIDLLYEKQDSLGLKSFGAFAHDVGVTDTARINACASNPDTVPLIEAGKRLGAEVGLKGTPTIVLNGWVLTQQPTESMIDSVVEQARKKR